MPRHRKNLPAIWLMTDERVPDAALLRTAARLPRGRAGIVFRHYHMPSDARRVLFEHIRAIARRRRLVLVLAGNMRLATAWKADGWHGPDARRATWPLLHSMAAHDAREVRRADRAGADLLFLSPLFPTRSHPGVRALGRIRFAALARSAPIPVMALGGVRPIAAARLRPLGAAGYGAIDGLV